MRILVVEDDPISAFSLSALIEDLGHAVELAEDGVEALAKVAQEHFDVVISDWMMPQMDGLTLCRRLRERSESRYLYVILVTSRGASEDRWEGLAAGADDFLVKPPEQGEIKARLTVAERILTMQATLEAAYAKLEEANARLQALASTDGLTGINNHRTFQERIRQELARAERTGAPLSLLLLDIDSFKNYNDTFGHQSGDDVLKQVAQILEEHARASDTVARYGGEEFVVILPDTGRNGAIAIAERLRAAIEAAPWPRRPITASFGVATLAAPATDPAALISAADGALYASKRHGRNRVTHADTLWDSGTGK